MRIGRLNEPRGLTFSFVALLLSGCVNTAPVVTILSPTSDEVYVHNQAVLFEGVLSDEEDGPEDLKAVWSRSFDGQVVKSTTLPDDDGHVFSTLVLAEGELVVTLTGEDSSGATMTDSITITVDPVNVRPVVTITAPEMNVTFEEGAAIVFSATVVDEDDGPEAVSLVWTSNIDGEISTQGADSTGAASFTMDTLTPGLQQVTVAASDPWDGQAQDAVRFVIDAGS
jgi:hypothetical protein